MKTIDAIKTRRSKRSFLDKEVPKEIVTQLLEAAIHAPSAKASQAWHFVIIKDKETHKKMASLKLEANRNHILTAPLTIVVFGDSDKSPKPVEDGVCAAMNILLTAHSLGLGAVYVDGFHDKTSREYQELQNIVHFPDNFIPVVFIPIGYADPNEEIKTKETINLDERTHYETW